MISMKNEKEQVFWLDEYFVRKNMVWVLALHMIIK